MGRRKLRFSGKKNHERKKYAITKHCTVMPAPSDKLTIGLPLSYYKTAVVPDLNTMHQRLRESSTLPAEWSCTILANSHLSYMLLHHYCLLVYFTCLQSLLTSHGCCMLDQGKWMWNTVKYFVGHVAILTLSRMFWTLYQHWMIANSALVTQMKNLYLWLRSEKEDSWTSQVCKSNLVFYCAL